MMSLDNNIKAIFLILIGMFVFTIQDVLIKMISDSINIYVLGMCLIEIFESTETNDLLNQNAKRLQMPIGEFLYEVPSITKIFRINETFFYQLLEELITVYPNIFSFTDTAGQKIIELKDPAITSNYFIDQMYQK